MKPNSKTLIIPASITVLAKASFQNATEVCHVKFEAGSRLRRLETGTFGLCRSLQSVDIAASVEFIGTKCFVESDMTMLKVVRFEAGSKLREIESDAFYGCFLLRELTIPASVEKMSGASLPEGKCVLKLEPGNEHFGRQGDFLVDLKHPWILRYLGSDSDITIGDEIEKIDQSCFYFGHSICSVTFGPDSKLRSIESLAFYDCLKLKSIDIPSSVTFLGNGCFSSCSRLRSVSFCSGSMLNCISDKAFPGCSLQKIIIPSTVKTIGRLCLSSCKKLETVSLAVDSELVRIEKEAFRFCSALRSLFLPSSVEFVGARCFEGCLGLSSLTFGSPSHLREFLDLPRALSGFISIPDSVEILGLFGIRIGLWSSLWTAVLHFGVDSRLREIRTAIVEERGDRSDSSVVRRSLLVVSSRSLKVFRADLEFEGGT
jgi:hypothetical protein